MKLNQPKTLLTGPPRVGKTTLIRKAVARMPAGRAAGFITDEIGRMEVFSALFCSMVRRIVDSEKQLLGTVAAGGGGLIAEVKQRPDIRILTVTPSNREDLLERIVTGPAEKPPLPAPSLPDGFE